jgi:hypothetical protein
MKSVVNVPVRLLRREIFSVVKSLRRLAVSLPVETAEGMI